MSSKNPNNRDLAVFFAGNTEKDNIIAAIFDHLRLDCLERCNINSSHLDELIRKFNESDACDIDLITSIIDTIKTGKANSLNKENELIKKIVSCVLEHLMEEISIEEIAQKLNISYYYMCHIFKNKYNISVNTFRNRKRLEFAMRRLVESDEKIADIAIACGFNNISYFTEIFTKMVGSSPTAFRTCNQGICLHSFYDFDDMLLAVKMSSVSFAEEKITAGDGDVKMISVYEPNDRFAFLHESAIIAYHGVLYASWYNCPKHELRGYTPICERRSYDGGITWSELNIVCDDKSEKILYCPPVYGICDDKLYMLVNQMVAPDHIHSLDLYVLSEKNDRFEFLWSRPIPFKLNTNVVALPNGKLMLPGRIAELDGFPNTPAVLISDSGKIDAQWRLVKIAENGDLPDGKMLIHPEISVMLDEDTLYMFSRDDQRRVPLVYISKDCGENWSSAMSHDIPYVSSKIYAGNLSDGKKYITANIEEFDRSKLAVYFTDTNSNCFHKRIVLFDKKTAGKEGAVACHYPAAFESNGKLYIIATLGYEDMVSGARGAVLFIVDISKV
ncbi:MAG: helix-turn-helix domain-containing protein [Clostridia bacterium]|nr:helix-turn-helix domain-containing protein [Clostridia bacterium]